MYMHAYIRELVYKNVNITYRISCSLQTIDIFARFHPRGCVCSTSRWHISIYIYIPGISYAPPSSNQTLSLRRVQCRRADTRRPAASSTCWTSGRPAMCT